MHWSRVILGCIIFVSCNSATVPEEKPGVEGVIVARDIRTSISGTLPTVHIRAQQDECGVILTIGSSTDLWRRQGRNTVRAQLDEFVAGKSARAWTDGAMLLSCPGQASAVALELLY